MIKSFRCKETEKVFHREYSRKLPQTIQLVDDHSRVAQMSAERIPPVHPEEILLEEFMKPMGISQNALASALKVPPRRINEIVRGKRGVSVDTALRLSRHFGTSVQFWLGLQADYELDAAEDSRLVDKINNEVAPRSVATR